MATEIYIGNPPPAILDWCKRKYPENKCLCFTALSAESTVMLENVNGEFVYSTDGVNFADYELGTTVVLQNVGDSFYIKAKSKNDNLYIQNNNARFHFLHNTQSIGYGSVKASGNIQYLLDSAGQQDSVPANCFWNLFCTCGCLTDISDLKLPAMQLADYCYTGMFSTNQMLTYGNIELPATVPAKCCYMDMFYDCENMQKGPDIKLESLTEHCCNSTFRWCGKMKNLKVHFKEWYDTYPGSTTNWLFSSLRSSDAIFTCPKELDTSTRDVHHIPPECTIETF